MKKKVLAILLAAIMVVALVPTVAFAEGSANTWEYNSVTNTFTVNCTIPTQGQIGETIPGPILFEDTYDGIERIGTAWTVEVESSGENIYEYDSKFWGTVDDSEEFAANKKYGYVFSIAYDTQKIANLEGTTIIVNGKEYNNIGVVIPYNNPIDFSKVPGAGLTCTSVAQIFVVLDFGTLDENGNFEGGDFAPVAPNNKSNIKGTITAADFAYEMIIPSVTTLTEANYKEGVLLGSGDNAGLVTIAVTKHDCATIDVFYTVDLTNGNLTDGTTTITTNYSISDAADGTFAALAANTKHTVYTAGAVKNTYIKVSADETSWNAAPVGDYNATLVFNFAKKEAVVTIDDVFPKDLRVITTEDIENPAKYYINDKETVSAIFAEMFEGRDLVAWVVESNGTAAGNLYNPDLAAISFFDSFSIYIKDVGVMCALPLTAELMPISGGYRFSGNTTILAQPDADVVIDFIMEGDTLSKIKFSGGGVDVCDFIYNPTYSAD